MTDERNLLHFAKRIIENTNHYTYFTSKEWEKDYYVFMDKYNEIYESLMSRDGFREAVFRRDSHKCVICGATAVDAHHIIERKLFKDGGYYINNGASLCEQHHMFAETTAISCDDIRKAAKISKIVLPEHFDPELKYDKWGNVLIDDNYGIGGELFNQENVQKVLKNAGKLEIFGNRLVLPHIKDQLLYEIEMFCYFKYKKVIIQKEISKKHIPIYFENERFFYQNLDTRERILFTAWEGEKCVSCETTCTYAELYGFKTPEIVYEGAFDITKITELMKTFATNQTFIIRNSGEFFFEDFKQNYFRLNT